MNSASSRKNQEQRLREAIAYRNKQSNFGQIFNVYVDTGISAKDMNRPALQLELVKKELEVGLLKIRDLNIDERLVPIEKFELFAEFAV